MVEPIRAESQCGNAMLRTGQEEEEKKVEPRYVRRPPREVYGRLILNYAPAGGLGVVRERDVEADSWDDQSRKAAAEGSSDHDDDSVSVPYGDVQARIASL